MRRGLENGTFHLSQPRSVIFEDISKHLTFSFFISYALWKNSTFWWLCCMPSWWQWLVISKNKVLNLYETKKMPRWITIYSGSYQTRIQDSCKYLTHGAAVKYFCKVLHRRWLWEHWIRLWTMSNQSNLIGFRVCVKSLTFTILQRKINTEDKKKHWK